MQISIAKQSCIAHSIQENHLNYKHKLNVMNDCTDTVDDMGWCNEADIKAKWENKVCLCVCVCVCMLVHAHMCEGMVILNPLTCKSKAGM